MLSKENCAAILNAGSNMKISGLPKEALIEHRQCYRTKGDKVRWLRAASVPPCPMPATDVIAKNRLTSRNRLDV
jgi:hypothetical protein